MIEVQNLTKRYGEFEAVKSISFTAAPGQVTGFLGPNGAGKTTTMRMLTGFMPPTSWPDTTSSTKAWKSASASAISRKMYRYTAT